MAESTRADALSGVRSAYESQPKGRGEDSSPRFHSAAVGSTPYAEPPVSGYGTPASVD